jgi:ribosomal protein S18 acetylase RimI-like enzyme
VRLEAAAGHVEELLELEFLASQPYSSFVYDTEAEAKAIARYLVEAGVGEVASAQVVFDQETVAGVISFMDGTELRATRTAAAMSLVRGRKIDPRGDVRERMLLAAETLIDVGEADLYLSRIAVDQPTRRRGTATWMMNEYEDAGRRRGKGRLVLEVSPTHEAALRLYERCGFEPIGERTIQDPASGRTLTYRHMSKALT